jgi:hypothetical protein
MQSFRRFVSKLYALVRRGSHERNLDREITSHLSLLAHDFEERGMTKEAAREAARRAFGSVACAKELS